MRLLLLLLAGILLTGEAFDMFHPPPPTRIYYYLPTKDRVEQLRIANSVKRTAFGFRGQGSIPSSLRPIRFAPTRPPTLPPVASQSHFIDHDQSSLGQTNIHSGAGQGFSSFHSPTSAIPARSSSSLGQVPQFATGNDKPSSDFNHQPAHVAFSVQNKPTDFAQASRTPNFDNNHKSSDSQIFKQSSFEEINKSNSDEHHKLSSFGQHQEPFDTEKKTSFLDTQRPRLQRNPVCNVLPNPGTCRAALPRYYMDHETGTCNCFLFGGCTDDGEDESPGSFFTLEECQYECLPPSMEEGSVCKEIFNDDHFVSFVDSPSQSTQADHMSDDEFLATLLT